MIKYIVIFIVIWSITLPIVESDTRSSSEYWSPSYANLIISAFLALLGTIFVYCVINQVY